MKFNSKNRVLAFVILGSVVFICIYQFMKKDDSDVAKIKRDSRHGIAEIIKQEINPKSKTILLTYALSEGSTTYVGKGEYIPLTAAGDSLANHFFPVIYFSEDPGLSRLLIVADDYKAYDLVQPDSLKSHNALIKLPG